MVTSVVLCHGVHDLLLVWGCRPLLYHFWLFVSSSVEDTDFGTYNSHVTVYMAEVYVVEAGVVVADVCRMVRTMIENFVAGEL